MTDRQLAKVVCLVATGVDDAAVTTLELHFAPRIQVVRERRRRERRGGDRRQRASGAASGRECRHVRNQDGRRIDERRGVPVTRRHVPLPGSLRGLGKQITFVAPPDGDRRRLEAAESLRLAVRFQLGDGDAFRALYERHFDGVYAYLLTVLRDRHEAEDASQEVFMRAFRALPRFEFRGRRFEAWLFRIVRNHAIRVKHRIGPVSPADPGEIALWRDRRQASLADQGAAEGRLVALIEWLPTAQRQVIVLRYMVDLDWTDIAAVLTRSNAAVRQLEQRALANLRQGLAAVEPPPTSRTRSMPMLRYGRTSPVAARRRLALVAAIDAG